MAKDRAAVRAIEWQEAFPALQLFSALRLALGFRALLLAAIALVLTTAGWWVCGEIFSSETDPLFELQIRSNDTWPWQQPRPIAEQPAVPIDRLTTLDGWRYQSPFLFAWDWISRPFRLIYSSGIGFAQFVYLLLCALWALAVWSLFGGAISRLAAVSFAHRENVSWRQLAAFVVPHWPAYFVAPLFPVLGTFLAAAFLAVAGAIMRVGPGLLLVGVLWPLVLLIGFLMAFLLIVLFFGWPLMWGAVSAEGTDSFGALSHSYSYVYQRPLQYLMYALLATLAGVLGWYVVALFAYWTIELGNWGVSWGSGAGRLGDVMAQKDLDSAAGDWGAALIHFWNGCLLTLVLAFAFSYLWSASTLIYFLMRRLVDATELDEVFTPEEQQLHGLPPLKTGPDGVPDVADDPAANDLRRGPTQASA